MKVILRHWRHVFFLFFFFNKLNLIRCEVEKLIIILILPIILVSYDEFN